MNNYTPHPAPRTKPLNWAEFVKRTEGTDWNKPDPAYEFSQERKFNDSAALAVFTRHPDYDSLPESVKLVHSPEGFAWLGSEKDHVIQRECNPDEDVTE